MASRGFGSDYPRRPRYGHHGRGHYGRGYHRDSDQPRHPRSVLEPFAQARGNPHDQRRWDQRFNEPDGIHTPPREHEPNSAPFPRGWRGSNRGRRISHSGSRFDAKPQRASVDSKDKSWTQKLRHLQLSEINELGREHGEELVTRVFNNLKRFQLTLEHLPTLSKPGIMDAILRILRTVAKFLHSETGPQASQILAESLSDRCPKFHLQLKQYVTDLKSAEKSVERVRYASTPATKVCTLCALFKTLLEALPDSSWSCLPVDELLDATKHLQLCSTIGFNYVTEAAEIVACRDQIREQVTAKQRPADQKFQEWDNSEYRQIPILPKREEVCISGTPAKLRPNIVDGAYTDWMHYYDIQFRLLREDFIAPLRRGVCEYMQGVRGRKLKDVKVYRNVVILEPVFTREGICYSLHFELHSHAQKYNWEHSKRLLYGSLVCLSPDEFQTVIFATIANRKLEKLAEGMVEVQFEEGARILPHCQKTTFTMVESLAYFEASRHILRSLQTAEVDTMPFTRYLIHNQCKGVAPPQYLTEFEGSVLYDLNCLYGAQKPPHARNLNFNALDITQWPSADEIELDQSQLDAIQMALTQEIAVIQGPPGTGKTYIGLRIVEALLRNRNIWDPKGESPILVMCFTNHALDQFLEGILKQTSLLIETDSQTEYWRGVLFPEEPERKATKIIRVGGRSQSEVIQQFNIDRIRRGVYLPGNIMHEMKDLEIEVKQSTCNVLWQQLNESTRCFLPLAELQTMIDPEHLYQLLHHAQSPDERVNALQIWLGLCEVVYQSTKAPEESLTADEMENSEESTHASAQSRMYTDDFASAKPQQEDQLAFNLQMGSSAQSAAQGSERDATVESEPEEEEELIDIQGEAEEEEAARMLDDEFERFRPLEFATSATKTPRRSMIIQNTDSNSEDPFAHAMEGTETNTEGINRPADTAGSQLINIVQQAQNGHEILQWGRGQPPMTKLEADAVGDIHRLSLIDRWRLYNYWAAKQLKLLMDRNETEFQKYNRLCTEYKEASHQADRFALETADVIGMTTTGAAKYQHILHLVKPKIVIVEEAAEVLESHVVSALNAGSQHLILIGDHKQLRPKPNEYDLAKKYKLDVSLFERLVRKSFPCATLQIQHRMRPEIAELVCPHIYDTLINHESVLRYENVKGICKNLFFVQHEFSENDDQNLRSHSNPHESRYIPSLCSYLLRLGYEPSQITVLVTYTGQLMTMRKQMPKSDFAGVRVTTVDNFQGEENDIILLSLVRSNEEGNIGFLREANRVCVALSRAKMGFYCTGNFKILRDNAVIWERIMSDMEKKGCLGEALPLYCCNHPETKSTAKSPEDFAKNAPCGGCTRDCEFRLNCGHVCAQKCHIRDSAHVEYECKKRCAKSCSEGHPCRLPCHMKCMPCSVQVERLMPTCGHMQKMDCHKKPSAVYCENPCSKKCPSGHPCPLFCYERCMPCTFKVQKMIPICGHYQSIPCHIDPSHHDCMADCPKECENGHPCSKRCHEPCGRCTIKVKKTIPQCGHTIVLQCHQKPDPQLCSKRCERKLPCGHQCTLKCGQTCGSYPCSAKVPVLLECGHTKKVECHLSSDPNALKCEQPCEKKLPCTHTCHNKCCEPCTEQCNAVVNKLWPCGHKLKRKCYKAQDPESYPCQKACQKKLQCGHPCTNECGQPCVKKCSIPIERKYPCGHTNKVSCSSNPQDQPCGARCSAKLSCGHECEGKCSNCYKFRIHIPCKYGLNLTQFCGHTFPVDCLKLEATHPGKLPCSASCEHHKCSHSCGTDCTPCIEPCGWTCPHYRCSKLCHEVCNRPPCNERCLNRLPCGHQCIGICGEPCPNVCPQCKGRAFNKLLRGEKKFQKDQLYVQLGCGHIFTVEFMDAFIQQKPTQATLVGPKKCPDVKCGRWMPSNSRYGNAVKLALKDVEAIKKIARTAQEKHRIQLPEVLALQMRVNEPSIKQHMEKQTDIFSRSTVKSLKEDGWVCADASQLAGTVCRYQLYPPITETILQVVKVLASENPAINAEQKCLIEFLITALNFLDIIHVRKIQDVPLTELGEGVHNIHKQVLNFVWCLKCLIGKLTKAKISAQLLEDLESEQYRLSLLLQYIVLQMQYPEGSLVTATVVRTEQFLRDLEADHSLRVTQEDYVTHSRSCSFDLQLKLSNLLVKGFPPLVKGQWYKCARGHYYCIPPTREAKSVPKCPNC